MIEVTFETNDRSLRARLDKLPIEVMARLQPTIRLLTQQLLAGVRAAEPIKTGALRAATRSSVTSGETFIRGKVSIGPRPGSTSAHNVAAAALEYGVNRSISVRSHRARSRGGQSFTVKAYQRRVLIRPRRFLRGTLERIRPLAFAEIRAALLTQKL